MPTRRSVVRAAAMMPVLTLAPAVAGAAVLASDPALGVVEAYRNEVRRLNEMPGDIPEGVPTPMWDYLEYGDGMPVAETRDGAVAVLLLALEIERDFMTESAASTLIKSALGFLQMPASAYQVLP